MRSDPLPSTLHLEGGTSLLNSRLDGPERRRHPRASVNTTAVVMARHQPGVQFLIESVSVGGAKLIGPLTVARGERIGILFEVNGAPVDVAAEVIRVESFDLETDHVAVRFVGITDTARRLIRDLVAQLLDLEEEDDEAEERVIEVDE